MARVAKTASEDLFALHLRGDCRRFTAIQQVVQSVYSLSKLFSGIALHGSKLTRGAQKIDSGCVQWDGEGFPELGCVLIPSHRPPPSITVVCGPHKPVIFWLFVAYDINLGFVVLAWGDLSSHLTVTAGQLGVGGENATRAGLRERPKISTSGLF